ncbi:hypothetical protein NECAME_12508 [Necator americanus]|uniref:RRM domain-containing protein n=1 Tax=Necator americanus TaxID=51031 RepID=W2SZK6_NECAM|nr:hypothetical protein NECAME_12508 [Necator americanus]ETN75073.1 hypothetical protein NECAME_12508 [Necator americanus]
MNARIRADNVTLETHPPTEHRDRLFIGEIRRDWEPKRVEAFLRGLLPDAISIDAYAEGSPLVRNRGFAFVSFADVGAAVRAKEKLLNLPVKMGGRALTVDWARAEHTVSAEIMKTVANLFIRNIAPGTSEYALKQLFGAEEAGVARVKIQRTFGFIRFHKRAQAEAALEKLNGAVLNGSRLEVCWARPPPPGRRSKKTPPVVRHQPVPLPQQILQHPVSTHTYEGFPLQQIEAPLFTPPLLDISLLTPANTPVTNTPMPSSVVSAVPIAYFAPPPPLPLQATPAMDQSAMITSFSERVRSLGLGELRTMTSSVLLNNLVFYTTAIFIGCIRVDGPLAPSKPDAERNAIAFASRFFNIPSC